MIYLAPLFILMNIYYLLNWSRLDKPFGERNKSSKLDLVYYILKLISWFWIIIGLFSPEIEFFIILLSLGLIRVPVYHINKNWSRLLWRLTPPIHIIVMLIMLFRH
jgi:hypothetical protein